MPMQPTKAQLDWLNARHKREDEGDEEVISSAELAKKCNEECKTTLTNYIPPDVVGRHMGRLRRKAEGKSAHTLPQAWQRQLLTAAFEQNHLPTIGMKILASHRTGMSKKKITSWFNYRHKMYKKDVPEKDRPKSSNNHTKNAAVMWREYELDRTGYTQKLMNGTVNETTGVTQAPTAPSAGILAIMQARGPPAGFASAVSIAASSSIAHPSAHYVTLASILTSVPTMPHTSMTPPSSSATSSVQESPIEADLDTSSSDESLVTSTMVGSPFSQHFSTGSAMAPPTSAQSLNGRSIMVPLTTGRRQLGPLEPRSINARNARNARNAQSQQNMPVPGPSSFLTNQDLIQRGDYQLDDLDRGMANLCDVPNVRSQNQEAFNTPELTRIARARESFRFLAPAPYNGARLNDYMNSPRFSEMTRLLDTLQSAETQRNHLQTGNHEPIPETADTHCYMGNADLKYGTESPGLDEEIPYQPIATHSNLANNGTSISRKRKMESTEATRSKKQRRHSQEAYMSVFPVNMNHILGDQSSSEGVKPRTFLASAPTTPFASAQTLVNGVDSSLGDQGPDGFLKD